MTVTLTQIIWYDPGLDRESKMKLLESIFNDEEEGRNKVSNSINLHFTNPNMANMRMNKLPLDSSILNPIKGSIPLENMHSKIEHPRLHQKVGKISSILLIKNILLKQSKETSQSPCSQD